MRMSARLRAQRKKAARQPVQRPPMRTRAQAEAAIPAENEAFARAIEAELQRLLPLVPDVDRQDLFLIVQNLARPRFDGRSLFLKKRPGGGYIF